MKKNNKKGFTLMEMLIVVAIIAILIAVAIPTFTNNLKKAQDAADAANGRALYAAMASSMMLDPDNFEAPSGSTSVLFEGTTYTFKTAPTITANAAAGTIEVSVPQTAPNASPNPVVFTSGSVNGAGTGGSGQGGSGQGGSGQDQGGGGQS